MDVLQRLRDHLHLGWAHSRWAEKFDEDHPPDPAQFISKEAEWKEAFPLPDRIKCRTCGHVIVPEQHLADYVVAGGPMLVPACPQCTSLDWQSFDPAP